MIVMPAWLDQVPTIDYTPEKELVSDFESWGQKNGWTITDGSKLPLELRQRTDVLLEKPEHDLRLRLAILRKSRNNTGSVRVDASSLRTIVLEYDNRRRRWRVDAAGVEVTEDLLPRGWGWLVDLLFRQ